MQRELLVFLGLLGPGGLVAGYSTSLKGRPVPLRGREGKACPFLTLELGIQHRTSFCF